MIRILKFLFTGDWHLHEWETINTEAMMRSNTITKTTQDVTRYTLRCKKCGDIKFLTND